MSNEVYVDEVATSPSRDFCDDAPFGIKRPSVFFKEIRALFSTFESIESTCEWPWN
jgi:hypothetical protein